MLKIIIVLAAVALVAFCFIMQGSVLKKKNHECFKDLEQVRDELERSREREIALRESQTELVADLGRQLKDPVTEIRLACDLMKAELDSGKAADDGFMSEKVGFVYRKADKLEALVTDMLTSALDELGQFNVSCAATESRVLSDILKRYDDRQLVSEAAIPYVLIHTDRGRMSQVIGNIMENSYKYAKTRIDVSYLLTDDYLQMKITDHGPGIAEDETELVTKRFYRSRRFADDGTDGRGLGLYTAKTLMEKMDGQLLVENTDEGFCVTLLIKLS